MDRLMRRNKRGGSLASRLVSVSRSTWFLGVRLQHGVIARRFDVIHILDADEERLSAGFDRDAAQVGRLGFGGLEPFGQLLIDGCQVPRLEVLARPLDCGQQPGLGEGLEQVIQGVDLEGLDRMLVVGGDKDHRRPDLRRQCPQHVKTADLGHLHVQKHQVRPLFPDESDRLGAIAAFAHDLQVRGLGQQLPDARRAPAPRHRQSRPGCS